MFNENRTCWKKIFKVFVIISFFIFVTAGLALGICDYDAAIDIIYDDTILDILVWTAAGAFLGFGNLVVGMLILNIANNAEIIRTKLEEKSN
jgi:hypothetical protein